MKFRVTIGVLSGDFTAQQLVFTHLLDVAPEADFDQVEVLTAPFTTRLAPYFDAGTVPEVRANCLVLLLPGSGVPLADTDRLTVLGRFPGTVVRALLPED